MSESGRLVLVVDDDPTGRLMLRLALERVDLEVIECASGEKALELFAERRPDLVVLDLVMNGLDGFEVCRRLRGTPAGAMTPVLILTGMDDLDSIRRSYQAGATDFAAKPINWLLLSHRVRYLLRAQRTVAELRQSQGWLAQAQRAAHVGYWEWDVTSGSHSWSPEIRRILGRPEASPAGRREYLEALSVEDRSRLLRCHEELLRQGGSYSVELRLRTVDGHTRVVRDEGEAVVLEDGRTGLVRGTVQDVTELRAAEEQARFLADHDPVTGLPNRTAFTSWLGSRLAGAALRGEAHALLCIRLDELRRVNETLGHASGDRLLGDVATRLRASLDCVRPGGPADVALGRAGGNVFLAALGPLGDPHQATRAAEALHAGLRSPIVLDGAEVFVTASVGVAFFPADAASAEQLASHAASAAHHASRGSGDTRFFDGSMHAAALRRLSLDAELRRAIDNDELRLHLQPQLDSVTGVITGAEALVRWQHPQRGLVAPAEFVPFAEESGLIVPIGDWMLREACRCLARWLAAGLRPPLVAVNLCSRELLEPGVDARVAQALCAAGLQPAALEVEITETTLLGDTDTARRTIADLRARGVRVCLDDFGTGYSSLGYLKKFGIDKLKIDRSFVRDVTSSRHDGAIVSAILAIADSLGLDTVTEGVETAAQVGALQARGCRVMQGYLFGRPVPEHEFARMLAAAGSGKQDSAGPAGWTPRVPETR